VKKLLTFIFLAIAGNFFAQQTMSNAQAETQLKVKQLIEKKAAYNRMNQGEYDGYRIKIHFGSDRTKAREIKTKFSQKFPDYSPYEDYDQPNFIITVGDFRTKLEAFEVLKKIQIEFANSFVVKSKIKPMKV
jgi:SPOR domain